MTTTYLDLHSNSGTITLRINRVQGRHVALGIYPKPMSNHIEPKFTPASLEALQPGARVTYFQHNASGYQPLSGTVLTAPVKNGLNQLVYKFQPDGKQIITAYAAYTELIKE